MTRLKPCILSILVAGMLALGIFPAYVNASNPPVVTGISGPGVEEFVNSPGPFTFSVQVTGGTPPYTYVWKKTLLHTGLPNDVLQCGQDNSVTVSKTDLSYSGLSGDASAIYVEVTDSKDIMATWDYDDYTHVYFGRFYTPGPFGAGSAGCTVGHWSNPDQESWTKEVDGVCWAWGTQPAFPYTPSPKTVTSHPACAPPPEDNSWVVIVGGLAVVAVAAAAIARLLKNRPKKKGEQPPEQYILQLSKDTLKVSTEKSDSFTVTAWKVTEDGGFVAVPTAQITVTPPRNIPALVIQPATGNSSLTPSVSLRTFPGSVTGIITITASAGGRTVSADVKVAVEGTPDIEFD